VVLRARSKALAKTEEILSRSIGGSTPLLNRTTKRPFVPGAPLSPCRALADFVLDRFAIEIAAGAPSSPRRIVGARITKAM
jgi:hypothetical protein